MAKIIVCDDNPDILEMVTLILNGEGHEVVATLSGRELLLALKNGGADLVMLDQRMPGLDGFSVLSGMDRLKGVRPRVVIFSAKCGDEDKKAAIEAGADGYLPKPFTLLALLTAVNEQLEAVC